MNKVLLIPAVFFITFFGAAGGAKVAHQLRKPDTQTAPAKHIKVTNPLVFSDYFSDSQVDSAKWTSCYAGTAPDKVYTKCDHEENKELQCYKPANATESGGLLNLTAKKESTTCTNGMTYAYSSGLLQTRGRFDFLYGYAEARIKTVKGQGLWPAFWMIASDLTWPPETDIMEQTGDKPTVNREANAVYSPTNYADWELYEYNGPDFTAGFHTYGLNWQPGILEWYVDGQKVAQTKDVTWVPAKQMYLVLNLAVGGNLPGSPNSATPFPSDMQVDYVKVWKVKP